MSEPQQLHRLFGLSWIDFFYGTSVEVEIELDLSLKQQFLDVVEVLGLRIRVRLDTIVTQSQLLW